MHTIQINDTRMLPEDGLVIGNGDLSVSIYHGGDWLGFRLGKGDVWDRRMNYFLAPDPVDIDELKRGLLKEKWKCGPYGGAVEFLGEAPCDPERVRQICQGTPRSYNNIPTPCPKPAGEFQLFLPQDSFDRKIRSTLTIEDNIVRTVAEFGEGFTVCVDTRIHPEDNIIAIEWSVDGWDDSSRTGNAPPVRMAATRWKDPSIQEFVTRYQRLHNRSVLLVDEQYEQWTSLEPPTAKKAAAGERFYVIQRFAPELTYPKGFECAIGISGLGTQKPSDALDDSEATVMFCPENPLSGTVFVAVETTGNDLSRAVPNLEKSLAKTGDPAYFEKLKAVVAADAEKFWRQSSVAVDDEIFEQVWYETLHAQKAVLKKGKTAPGLFMPSTIADYTLWKGDYHTNYNIQQPYWSLPAANHPELMHPYFETMINWFLPLGRMIAEKYYHARGAFIQISGFPMLMAEDPIGIVPMGRMVYMTGWAVNQFWSYYLYTLDAEWLRETGYPFMRECCLFLHDILEKGEDGLYHLFPSNQGEDGFTGVADEYRDSAQIMHHIRYALMVAAEAAEKLGADQKLADEWREQHENLAPPRGEAWPEFDGEEKDIRAMRFKLSPPEFTPVTEAYHGPVGSQKGITETFAEAMARMGSDCGRWYFGAVIWRNLLLRIRGGGGGRFYDDATAKNPIKFDADLDFAYYREVLRRWRHPNGLYEGMAVANYGHCGHWFETLAAAAPMEEMLLQSWDGAIALFPCWPLNVKASFTDFRAEGAFLVSASCGDGKINGAEAKSLKGGVLSLYAPWADWRVECDGHEVQIGRDDLGRPCIQTQPGKTYAFLSS